MLSIFIMYSTDRSEALEYTLAFLRKMELYEGCQKTLVVDGKIDRVPPEWEVIEVPRLHDKFCWARMWDAGVLSARFDKILYLDSDRLLPLDYLSQISRLVEDDVFVFTSLHFQMVRVLSLEDCQALLDCRSLEELIAHPLALASVKYEPRDVEPKHGPGKNVMSGSTAFTKRTYCRLGGVDPWYCGHGAYADSDFHMQAAVKGCSFIDLEKPELHFPHQKQEQGKSLSVSKLWELSLDNFIHYCRKWNLPKALAEAQASRCGISRPSRYVEQRWLK